MEFPADFPYQERVDEAEQESSANFARLIAAHPWLSDVGAAAMGIATRGDKATAYKGLARLADRVTRAAAPHVACTKGCSHCCHISVVITEFEARQIGKACGIRPERVRKSGKQDELVAKYFGVPCPFLADGLCSIYAHRPLSCRTHVNLAATSFFCDTQIRPEWSFVPSLNLSGFQLAYGWLFQDEVAADLRDFFPG